MSDDERKLVANGHAALRDGGLGEEAPRQGARRPLRDVPERRARAAAAAHQPQPAAPRPAAPAPARVPAPGAPPPDADDAAADAEPDDDADDAQLQQVLNRIMHRLDRLELAADVRAAPRRAPVAAAAARRVPAPDLSDDGSDANDAPNEGAAAVPGPARPAIPLPDWLRGRAGMALLQPDTIMLHHGGADEQQIRATMAAHSSVRSHAGHELRFLGTLELLFRDGFVELGRELILRRFTALDFLYSAKATLLETLQKGIVQRKKHRSTLAGAATAASPARTPAQGLVQPRGNRYRNKKPAASSKVPSGEAAPKSPPGK
jgi:hypothetical protein